MLTYRLRIWPLWPPPPYTTTLLLTPKWPPTPPKRWQQQQEWQQPQQEQWGLETHCVSSPTRCVFFNFFFLMLLMFFRYYTTTVTTTKTATTITKTATTMKMGPNSARSCIIWAVSVFLSCSLFYLTNPYIHVDCIWPLPTPPKGQ